MEPTLKEMGYTVERVEGTRVEYIVRGPRNTEYSLWRTENPNLLIALGGRGRFPRPIEIRGWKYFTDKDGDVRPQFVLSR